jgi:hypothetical protein
MGVEKKVNSKVHGPVVGGVRKVLITALSSENSMQLGSEKAIGMAEYQPIRFIQQLDGIQVQPKDLYMRYLQKIVKLPIIS